MLTDQNFKDAANKLDCDVFAIKAVTKQEAGGIGFYKPSGKLIIKFEGHVFHRLTGGKHDVSHPTLSYPKWTEKYSQFGDNAYLRFNQAFALDKKAAMMATSWGMFQIMGENFSSCGFKSVDEFVDFMHVSELNHLLAFCQYCISQKLAQYLIGMAKDPLAYAGMFAARYNGPAYKANQYDVRIANGYLAFKRAG